jgi:hypothetical protein
MSSWSCPATWRCSSAHSDSNPRFQVGGDQRERRRGLQREEPAAGARLACPVGVQQDPVTQRQPQPQLLRTRAQAQRRRRLGWVQRGGPAAADQQRRGMPAVDHDRAAVGGDLDHHHGHEVLRADRAGDAAVQRRCHLGQVGAVLGGVPEAAQHHPGQPDRVQALAAHVPDQQPHLVRGLHRLVEVPPIEASTLAEAYSPGSRGRRNTPSSEGVDGTTTRLGCWGDRKAADAVAWPAAGGAA